jgi:hypothetical protein
MVLPNPGFVVWAYFPIYNRRRIARGLKPKQGTRVLLVVSVAGFDSNKREFFRECLQDGIGHVLLYLRAPKAQNNCVDAMKEWHRSTKKVEKAARKERVIKC